MANNIIKSCIFCGNPPENKNKEHVIPKWLIEMTGDKKRNGYFGFDKFTNETSLANATSIEELGKPHRVYSFNNFAFPACKSCNDSFGRKESEVKPIVERIINNKGVNKSEINIFLDWLDKVRVGLWLGMRQLDKNLAQIEPNFAISQRVRLFDRMVMIRRIKDMPDGINFFGVETYCFAMQPVAFCLRINEFFFFSLSSAFLVSEGLGFPFSQKMSLDENSEGMKFDVVDGTKEILTPVVKKSGIAMSNVFFQPIFGGGIRSFYKDFYNNDYVKKNSMSFEDGVGEIFIGEENPRVLEEDENVYFDYVPTQSIYSEPDKSMLEIVKFQLWFMSGYHSKVDLSELTLAQKDYVENKINLAKRINDMYVQVLQDKVYRLTLPFWK